MNVGILHPGAMGSALAAAATAPVRWVSEGRSQATRERAAEQGLVDSGRLPELVATCEVIVSVVPPHAALEVAHEVAALGYDGVYVDANAIAPRLAQEIGELFAHAVDGGIIGPPPLTAGTTRFYVSGEPAASVAELWSGGPLEVRVLGPGIGAASALKIAYAGWTKGSAALLLTMRAYAEVNSLGEALEEEWRLSIPGLDERVRRTATGSGPKAWRFAGEMEQIAAALSSTGLTPDFHVAAGATYATLAELKEADDVVLLDVLDRLLSGRPISAD